MRADLAIETPLKFFIVLVAAVMIISLLRQLYTHASSGVDDLVPINEQGEYELIELGTVSTSQLVSMVDSCYELGQKQTATQKEYGCYIVKGNFANVNSAQLRTLSEHVTEIDIPSGSNALFIVYDFPTQKVIIKP